MPLVTTLAAALAAAWVLGVVAQRLRLSPIVGYLLAGVAIGPYTPGFVGDAGIASQLAEIGVVLLMFGVGLHFHVQDLRDVAGVAVPGALVQSAVATLLGLGVGVAFGWPVISGLVLGMALSVASTVVLLRGLESRGLLAAPAGRVAVGWLIVEDVLTVLVLVVIPALADGGERGLGAVLGAAAAGLGKLVVMVAVVYGIGSRLLPRVLVEVARLRSRELFTLTVLALSIATAAGAAALFGASMALGAFLAGMVVGQSPVSQQAAADALPLRDAFAVLFFVSVGMLFDPSFLLREPLLLAAGLLVVLVGKPLAAVAVVAALGYSSRVALVSAIGLAQIGEFSFILGALARDHGLLPEVGFSLLVACALVSISLHPLLLALLDPAEAALRRSPLLWRLLNGRSLRRGAAGNAESAGAISAAPAGARLAVVVGYGPVGRAVDEALRASGSDTVVVDLNMDTVTELRSRGRSAIFGDASHPEVLEQAGLARASHLVVTLPHSVNRAPMIAAARARNAGCRVFVRARYVRERGELAPFGPSGVCFEEAEAVSALTALVLRDLGWEPAVIAEHAGRARENVLRAAGGAL